MADKPKKRRDILNTAREERIWDLLTQPELLGLVATLGGIYASQKIRFVDKAEDGSDIANEGFQAVATSTSILLGLGYAGVGDLTTSIIAGLSAVASIIEGLDPGSLTDQISEPGSTGWDLLGWMTPVTWGLSRAFGNLPKPSYL